MDGYMNKTNRTGIERETPFGNLAFTHCSVSGQQEFVTFNSSCTYVIWVHVALLRMEKGKRH